VQTWQAIRSSGFEWHVHREAYAAVVLAGSYEEAGDSGRHRVLSGDVILHEAFEAHLDLVSHSGAEVLNLPLPAKAAFCAGRGSLRDPAAIISLVEKEPAQAAAQLLSSIQMRESEYRDWPDQLAAMLARDPSVRLSAWGQARGISPWELSRGFSQIFGVSARVFRARARARLAWKAICRTRAPLAAIAAELGFADQSHMTRSIQAVTGRPPQGWRHPCK
jgi:AraC-like DNA-binding protein